MTAERERGRRILIVRIAALGDVAVSSTVLSRIAAESPGASVTWLCGAAVSELVSVFPGVDDIVTVDEQRLLRGAVPQRALAVAGVWRALAGRRFDTVLTLHADPRYRVLTWPVWAQRRYALRAGGSDANPLPERYRGDEYARLLDGETSAGPILASYGMVDVRGRLPAASRSPDDARPAVALVPGGTRNVLREGVLRRWPVASYRALAERLVRDGVDVVLVGDGHDQWVTPEFAGVRVRNEIGRHSITGTLGVLRSCRLVVSHDTGPLHLARLVRTPAVALFGPTSPRGMVGDAPDVTWLWGGAHLACRPCYDGREFARCENNLCMQSISVDEVHAAVQRRLASVVAEAEAVAPAVRGPSGAAGVTR